MPIVKNCVYKTQAEDFQQAKQLLPQDEWSVLKVSEVPSSYECVPVVPSDAFAVESTFGHAPGVYSVTGPNQQIRSMNKVIRVLQIVFLALAAVLLLSAMVLILNTIRMAIFSRRREVSVMKLVGATNWFIRIPYITEGFIQGLLGFCRGDTRRDGAAYVVSAAQRVRAQHARRCSAPTRSCSSSAS